MSEFEEKFIDYLEDRLSSEDKERFEHALKTNPELNKSFNQYSKIIALEQKLSKQKPPKLSSFSTKVMEQINLIEDQSFKARFLNFIFSADKKIIFGAVAVAATIVVALKLEGRKDYNQYLPQGEMRQAVSAGSSVALDAPQAKADESLKFEAAPETQMSQKKQLDLGGAAGAVSAAKPSFVPPSSANTEQRLLDSTANKVARGSKAVTELEVDKANDQLVDSEPLAGAAANVKSGRSDGNDKFEFKFKANKSGQNFTISVSQISPNTLNLTVAEVDHNTEGQSELDSFEKRQYGFRSAKNWLISPNYEFVQNISPIPPELSADKLHEGAIAQDITSYIIMLKEGIKLNFGDKLAEIVVDGSTYDVRWDAASP